MSMPLGRGFDERVPLILVLDTSASMANPAGAPRITELNAALRAWIADAEGDPALRDRLEIAMVTFDSTITVLEWPGDGAAQSPGPFRMPGGLTPPTLRAGGLTFMLPAIEVAIDLASQRSRELHEAGIPSRRPQVWLVTDGAPSEPDGEKVSAGDLAAAARRVRAAEQPTKDGPGCLFYAVGVGGADRATLRVLAPESNHMLSDFPFREILRLASQSASTVRSSATASQAYAEVHEKADQMRQFLAWQEGLR
jgi:uncharacterized protein YegL